MTEETADTSTLGFVYRSELIEGLTFTADYWDIQIESAISSPSDDNIVTGCYIGETLNDNFCQLFTRNQDPTSQQFGGFNFIRSAPINFAKVETAVDVQASYNFNVDDNQFGISIAGTSVDVRSLY